MTKSADTLLYDYLVDYGLADKEARTYLALMEMGQATATNLAKKTGLNRSTTYVILESLKHQGLVSVTVDKIVQEYIASTPERFVSVAEDRLREQKMITDKIRKIVPDLKLLRKDVKHKPIITLYEGRAGVKNILEESLGTKEKLIRIMSSADNLQRIVPGHVEAYAQERAKRGIKMKGIHPAGPHAEVLSNKMPSFDEVIIIPAERFHVAADIAIYDNKISYITAENKGIGITIESKEVTDMMKNLFDLAWEEAKRLNADLVKGSKVKAKSKKK